MIRRFLSGFGFVFLGWRHFHSMPGLKKWIAFPLIIDFILFIAGIYIGWHSIHGILWRIIFFVVYLFFIYVSASIIGMPFYRILAAKTLERLGFKNERKKFSHSVIHSGKMTVFAIERAVILTIAAVIFFGLSFVPGLNVLTTFVGFILVAFDMTNYALDLKGYHLVEQFRFLLRASPEYLGMAAFIALTAFVPGLIVLSMPFAIIGATIVVQKDSPRITVAE